jgi:hypothetical protein
MRNINGGRKMENKKEVLDEVNKYSPHSEQLTLSTLMAINRKIHVCNVGSAGIGKTRNTEELLNLMKIPHNLVAGHITPRAFFDILKKDGIIVVDEGATLLSDRVVQDLLLNALWNQKVEWKNNREELTHFFKGIIIFNTNKVENSPIMQALQDRIFTNRVELNSDQIKDKIMSGRDYRPNMKVWAKIKEQILEKTELSEPLNNRLYQIIEGSSPKSVRDLWKLQNVAAFSMCLVGDFDLIEYFTETDDVWKIMNSKSKRSEKV